MKPNPPIPGHELLYEGGTQPIWGDANAPWGAVQGHKGGCACGAQPPDFPNVSNNKMKQWHREHKAQIRGEMISQEQNERYVLELAVLLTSLEKDTPAFDQCMKDLRTAVAFLKEER